MAFSDLEPAAAEELIEQDPDLVVLDVRTDPEYQSHRLRDAVLIPVQELQQRVAELTPDRPHLVYCEHGMRSVAACEILAQAGFAKLSNLRGGIAHWAGNGHAIERG